MWINNQKALHPFLKASLTNNNGDFVSRKDSLFWVFKRTNPKRLLSFGAFNSVISIERMLIDYSPFNFLTASLISDEKASKPGLLTPSNVWLMPKIDNAFEIFLSS